MNPPKKPPQTVAEYLTVEQVAEHLGVSTNTVGRQFGRMEGVIDIGTPETRFKRRKRCLRISRRTLEKYIEDRQVRRSRLTRVA
jgi:AraC-like DNA-binding protein